MTTSTTTAGTTMQAIIQENYGEAENVLRLGQTGRPAIGDREVLLRVHAAGVDRGVRPLRQLRRALTPRGTLVIIGGETDGRWLGGSDRQLRAVMLSPFTSQHLSTLLCSENQADLIALTEMIESGQVTPVIDKVYPLSETITAIRYMRDGHARGKVVIDISDASHR